MSYNTNVSSLKGWLFQFKIGKIEHKKPEMLCYHFSICINFHPQLLCNHDGSEREENLKENLEGYTLSEVSILIVSMECYKYCLCVDYRYS